MDINWGIAGLVAAAGLVGGFWRQAKSIWFSTTAYIVARVNLDVATADCVYKYLGKKMKPFPMREMNFFSYFIPLKNGFYEQFVFEDSQKGNLYFRDGWKFLCISKKEKNGNNNPETTQSRVGINSNEKDTTISYLRIFGNIENIIKEAVIESNNEKERKNNIKRYYVKKVSGYRNQNQENDSRNININSNQALVNSNEKSFFYEKDKRLISHDVNYVKSIIQETEKKEEQKDLLFFPKEIEKYVEEIKTWKKSKDWYLQKGLSWTFGWLLHGEPGTGKTSLVKKVAKLIDFPVVIFDIASMSNNDFINAWNNCKTLIAPCVIIIEDIDSVFRDRKNILGEMGGGLTFDCVLNCISGFEENTGIFVVITTNNIKHIDHAIGIPNTIDNETISSRPGRIDRVIYVGKMEKECRLELAKRIFADVDVSRDYIDNIVSKGDGMTAAQFSDVCKKECLQIYWDKKTMMQNHKFSELLRKKKVSWNDIDDFISQWHESDSNEPICSYLGIDESIYASWVENPDSVKNMVI